VSWIAMSLVTISPAMINRNDIPANAKKNSTECNQPEASRWKVDNIGRRAA